MEFLGEVFFPLQGFFGVIDFLLVDLILFLEDSAALELLFPIKYTQRKEVNKRR